MNATGEAPTTEKKKQHFKWEMKQDKKKQPCTQYV